MKNIIVIVIATLVFIFATATYTVDQRETAIKFRFKEIVETDIKPGLHFKMPFVNTIEKFSTLILSTRTIIEAVSTQRDEIMTSLKAKAEIPAKQLGIKIIDARVSKIDFTDSVSESVFERMRSERQRVAQDFRSRGLAEGEKIRAEADRKATIIEADAYREAEKIRGEGDAISAKIYADAYQKNAEFYAFYRSLGAYEKSLGQGGDIMVVEPDAEFFKYFRNQGGK